MLGLTTRLGTITARERIFSRVHGVYNQPVYRYDKASAYLDRPSNSSPSAAELGTVVPSIGGGLAEVKSFVDMGQYGAAVVYHSSSRGIRYLLFMFLRVSSRGMLILLCVCLVGESYGEDIPREGRTYRVRERSTYGSRPRRRALLACHKQLSGREVETTFLPTR